MRIDNPLNRFSFSAVYRQAQHRMRSGKLSFCLKKTNTSKARLGISVAKRYVPKAVSRNYIKRINRECFRACQEKLNGFDVVVSVRENVSTLSRSELYHHVLGQWDRLLVRYGH